MTIVVRSFSGGKPMSIIPKMLQYPDSYNGRWLSFVDKCNRLPFLRSRDCRFRQTNNRKEIPNWQDFVCRWDTNVGDLFLIPPGTTHGHGGNQMILEMDTGPSVAGTEYSFFTYDFARNTWDDYNGQEKLNYLKMNRYFLLRKKLRTLINMVACLILYNM